MNVDGRVVRVCAMALGKERQWTKSQQEGATTRAQKELVDRRASAAIAAGECNGGRWLQTALANKGATRVGSGSRDSEYELLGASRP